MKQEKNQLRIGIILNYVNMILGNLIPIFYTPVMLSLLGQSEYGLYKLSGSVTSYLSLISLGIGGAMTRYLIKAREEEGRDVEERFLGLFMVIFQIIAVLALVVGTALTLNLQIWYGDSLTADELSRMKLLVFLMVCNTALSFSQSPYVAVVGAHEKFIFQQCINIVTTCIGPLLNIVMLVLGFASIGMAMSTLLIGVLCRVVFTLYTRRVMGIRAKYRDMPTCMLREILTFSFWVFVSNVVGQLYNMTDTVMMGAVPELATTGVAVYSVGNIFNSVVFSLTIGISSLLAPKVNRMVFSGTDNTVLTDLAIQVGRVQGLIFGLVVSGFVVFGKQFTNLYAGKGYEDAYWVALLMMIPNMVPLVQSVCLNVITARNQHQFRALVYLGIAIVNVVGTWFLMHVIGIIGAALMTGLALIVGQGFVMNWYYHQKTGLNMIRFWKEVGKVYLIPAAMCGFMLTVGKYIDFCNWPNLLLGIACYTAVYCSLNWYFVINSKEKNKFMSFLKEK